jgi:hypothetical protein
MPRVNETPPGLTLHNTVRSGFVLAGLLFLGVGIGDVLAGRAKITQYRELVRTTRSDAPPDPTALFPTASEGQERHAVFIDKLAFYQLWVTAGQLLAALGIGFVVIGLLRLRIQTPRPHPNLPLPN